MSYGTPPAWPLSEQELSDSRYLYVATDPNEPDSANVVLTIQVHSKCTMHVHSVCSCTVCVHGAYVTHAARTMDSPLTMSVHAHVVLTANVVLTIQPLRADYSALGSFGTIGLVGASLN